MALGVPIVLCCASGCGGSGGSSSSAANPYAGAYSGEFVDQADFIGPFTLVIASNGTLSGQLDYATPATLTGSINSSGVGSVTYNNTVYRVQLGAAGQPVLGGGFGTTTNGAYIAAVTNPTGVYSGFSGGYAGTVHNATLNATGIIALSVSSSGSVVGVDLFDVNGVPTLEPLQGTLSSSGGLSYTVDGVTVTGTVAQSGTTVTGAIAETNGDSGTITLGQLQPVG